MKSMDSRAILVEHYEQQLVGANTFTFYMNQEVVQVWHDRVETCAGLTAYPSVKVPYLPSPNAPAVLAGIPILAEKK